MGRRDEDKQDDRWAQGVAMDTGQQMTNVNISRRVYTSKHTRTHTKTHVHKPKKYPRKRRESGLAWQVSRNPDSSVYTVVTHAFNEPHTHNLKTHMHANTDQLCC